ncbi:thioesterase II family protein [Hathewaya histolytica]|uniref:thioesterase II family protein n=1 Tax=Hathewaya histolytica TaxID=1498 RepID=UPI003B677B18
MCKVFDKKDIPQKIKLFCIPHAGGSASSFYSWFNLLENYIELVPVELKGRGMRIDEPFYNNWEEAVDDIFKLLIGQIKNEPYAILGHSLGSWLLFDVLQKIYVEENQRPVKIFLSGNIPPHTCTKYDIISSLPDKEFIDSILNTGDIPRIIFENKELRSFYLPIFRSDYALVEQYPHKQIEFKTDADIHVLYGREDSIEEAEMKEWEIYSEKGFFMKCFEGGHMFIFDQKVQVTKYLNDILESFPRKKSELSGDSIIC